MQFGVEKLEREKAVLKGDPRLDPAVLTASGTRVTVKDCVDGRNWLAYTRDGKLRDDVPGSHFQADATVERKDGAWKVSHFYMHEAGSC